MKSLPFMLILLQALDISLITSEDLSGLEWRSRETMDGVTTYISSDWSFRNPKQKAETSPDLTLDHASFGTSAKPAQWVSQPRRVDCNIEHELRIELELRSGRSLCIADATSSDPTAPAVVDQEAVREAFSRKAFSTTVFAHAIPSMQPPGNATLVNLPTYYRSEFASDGFSPNTIHHIDPTTMFGRSVAVRPRLVAYMYHFGDGAIVGPTQNPGGVYPTGTVTHTYRKPGVYPVRVDVTYSADVSIDNGPFLPINEKVTITGPITHLTVKEAHTRLIKN